MDLSFLRRAEKRFASRTAAHPDFGMLLAALRTQASSTPAVQAVDRWGGAFVHPLAEILLAGPGWRRAVTLQGGCFNPRHARQAGVN